MPTTVVPRAVPAVPRTTLSAPVVTRPPMTVVPRPNDHDADNVGGPNDNDGAK
jgi:hypothetical protein